MCSKDLSGYRVGGSCFGSNSVDLWLRHPLPIVAAYDGAVGKVIAEIVDWVNTRGG